MKLLETIARQLHQDNMDYENLAIVMEGDDCCSCGISTPYIGWHDGLCGACAVSMAHSTRQKTPIPWKDED